MEVRGGEVEREVINEHPGSQKRKIKGQINKNRKTGMVWVWGWIPKNTDTGEYSSLTRNIQQAVCDRCLKVIFRV